MLVVQSALTVWVMALTLRAHGLGNRPGLLTAMIAALSILTTLPFLTAILLTDIFAGLSVLALYLAAAARRHVARLGAHRPRRPGRGFRRHP